MSTSITRRAALTGTVAGAAAVLAGAVPARADVSQDPIFAAIEWESRIVETDDPRWIDAVTTTHETGDAADALAWGLLENPPVTAAGAAALMAYADSAHDAGGPLREGWFPDNWQEAAYRTIARASLRLAGGTA